MKQVSKDRSEVIVSGKRSVLVPGKEKKHEAWLLGWIHFKKAWKEGLWLFEIAEHLFISKVRYLLS